MLKGLQSIIGLFQTWSALCEFSDVKESFTAKEEDGFSSFLILDVLEAKIFQDNFLEGIMSEKMSVFHRQHTEI